MTRNSNLTLRDDRYILGPEGGAGMTSDAQKRASTKYDKANTKGLYLKLNINTDSDVLDRLEAMSGAEGGKQGYIKALIRRDIAQNRM